MERSFSPIKGHKGAQIMMGEEKVQIKNQQEELAADIRIQRRKSAAIERRTIG